ncbi:MAG: aminodeoxychorismate/anthranilate synthase component II [Candidatus Brocadiae bacterium]|nr:aminodeoxychorismate/anthranilate synthase component II [Candidatus Brocadiia bacterium]
MLLLIDNYDSFTWNLVQIFGELGAEIVVRRNDEITLDEAKAMGPAHVVISPGPGDPGKAGVSKEFIGHFAGKIPVLGVCLGHQAIGEVFGGVVSRADRQMHGKVSLVYHDNKGLYRGVPNPFPATRYHSLVVREETLPPTLKVVSHTVEGEIMGLRHKVFPLEGVQFHPESILTAPGRTILRNFLEQRAPE